MLSVSAIKSAGGAADYYGRDDYYVTGEADAPGLTWGGKGATALGWKGEASPHEFRQVLDGSHPALTSRKPGAERSADVGAPKDAKHRPGWDLTFSAPKSVSVMILIGGDTRLDAAHNRAVSRAMDYVERHLAVTRVRVKGEIHQVKTGNLVYASTVHGTSRDADPQRHTHVVVANATVDHAGEVRALETKQIYKHQELIGAIYQSELAKAAMALGYDVQKGKTPGTFELAGLPREQLLAFSKAHARVMAAIAAATEKAGETLSPAQREAAIMKSRPKKLDVHRSALIERWKATANEAHIAIDDVRKAADRRDVGRDLTLHVSGKASQLMAAGIAAFREFVQGRSKASPLQAITSLAVNAMEQRKAVFTQQEVLGVALRYAPLGVSAADIELQVGRLQNDGALLQADRRVHGGITTAATLQKESQILAAIAEGQGASRPIMSAKAALARLAPEVAAQRGERVLNDEQRAAVVTLLSSSDRFVGVRGFAGVGKTTMFEGAQRLTQEARLEARLPSYAAVTGAAREAGVELFGLAATHSAVGSMKREAGIPASTIDAWLLQAERKVELGGDGLKATREAWSQRAVVVDEASMLSNDKMLRICKVAERLDIARVMFVGDDGQLGSPEAGAPYRAALFGGLKHAEVTKILRQKKADLLKAVEHLARGEGSAGLKVLRPRTVEVGADASRDKLAGAAVEAWKDAKDRGVNATIIVATNAMRETVSGVVRAELGMTGDLSGPTRDHDVLAQVRMSDAEKPKAAAYRDGDVLVLHGRAGAFRPGESLRVVGRDGVNDRLVVRAAGSTAKVSLDLGELARAKAGIRWEAYSPGTLEVRSGEQLVLDRRDKDRDISAGATFTVVAMNERTWTIRFEDGRTEERRADDPALRFVSHAYASTADRQQGNTNKATIAILDSRDGEAANHARLYVMASRASDEFTLVTNDANRLAIKINTQSGQNLVGLHELNTPEAKAERAGLGRDDPPEKTIERAPVMSTPGRSK